MANVVARSGIYERVEVVETKRFSCTTIGKLFFTFPKQENHHCVSGRTLKAAISRREMKLPLSIRRRFNPVFFEDVSDGLIGDLMVQVGKCSLDAIVSPGYVFTRQAKYEFDDLLLIAMHPADENRKEELPGLKNEVHGGPHVKRKNLTMSPSYLAVVSLNPAVELDLELLKPLYLKSEDPKVAMLRLGQIYAAAASRSHGGQEQLLTEMRQRLPALSKAENQRDQDVLFRSLGANVRYSLVSDVLREASPSLFVAYAEGTSLSRNEIAGQFLSKAIAVEFDDTTPYRAFLEVLDQVELSIWIDEELIAVNQKCKMKLSGTWQDVTQRLAAGLGWRFVEISDGIFYLGPGDKLKHTDPMLISSRRKLPIPGDIHPELDRAISTLEFRQQTRFIDVPLSEVAALLAETTSITIDVRVVDRKIVTSISQKIPVHLTLSLVCYQADAKWSIDDTGAVVIEPDPSSQREAHQRERREAQQFREELERQKAAAR